MTIGALIAAFVREEHEIQAVLAALGGYLGAHGRPMPHAVMTAISHMLPRTFATHTSCGIAGVAVMANDGNQLGQEYASIFAPGAAGQ